MYTTTEAAAICKVAPRTVCKWFDTGLIKGYRLPLSGDRRIPEEELQAFLLKARMPTIEQLKR